MLIWRYLLRPFLALGAFTAALRWVAWLFAYEDEFHRYFLENRPLVAVLVVLYFISYGVWTTVDDQEFSEFKKFLGKGKGDTE